MNDNHNLINGIITEGQSRSRVETISEFQTAPKECRVEHERRAEMPELNDLSGPFKPDLRFEDFSKEFLLKLMNIWEFAWVHLQAQAHAVMKERFGFEAANEALLEILKRMSDRVNPRYAKLGNIQLNTVVDSLKCLQLPLDNNIGGLYPAEFDIKDPNHVIMTITQCRSLLFCEREAPELIEPQCHVMEQPMISRYLINPKIRVTPLKLPPRNSPDEIACQWEFTLET